MKADAWDALLADEQKKALPRTRELKWVPSPARAGTAAAVAELPPAATPPFPPAVRRRRVWFEDQAYEAGAQLLRQGVRSRLICCWA
jgi:hypothetical protein